MQTHYSTTQKDKILNKLFLILLSLVYLGLSFKTAQAEEWQTVEEGQYFWQISKPGLNPSFSYIMGSGHHMCLDKNSLPIEIKRALKSSRMAVLEATRENTREAYSLETLSAVSHLPAGLTLSHYLGEKKVKEMFDVIRSFIESHDTEEQDLERALKTLHMDIRDYNNFNRLAPQILDMHLQFISHLFSAIIYASEQESNEIIQEFITSINKSIEQVSDGNIMSGLSGHIGDFGIQFEMTPEFCSSDEPLFMDTFIEKSLFCDRTPIELLETAVERAFAVSFVVSDLKIEINRLYDNTFSAIKNKKAKLENKNLSPPFGWIFQDIVDIRQRELRPFENFQMNIDTNTNGIFNRKLAAVYTGSEEDSSEKNPEELSKDIIALLKSEECWSVPEINSLADSYVNKFLQKTSFALKITTMGKPMDEKTTEIYLGFIRELKQIERHIFSSCFPNYQYSNKELQDIEDKDQEELYTLRFMVGLATTRDPNFVNSILPFLDEGGGVFVLMGFGHLSGVINHLKAAGYNVHPVQLSSPIIEADCNKDITEALEEGLNFFTEETPRPPMSPPM